MAYRYSYFKDNQPLVTCPECGQSLIGENSIRLVLSTRSGHEFERLTRLDEGSLIDVDGEVASGNHSATECNGCGEMLINLDGVEEDQDEDNRPVYQDNNRGSANRRVAQEET